MCKFFTNFLTNFEIIKLFSFRDEISRNRKKVMEINYFLDNQRDEFEKIQN